jgi:hypothetical protein
MDLFGLMSLDPISTDVYNIQTAEYISSFYDGDVAVSISTILVAVTDENIPIGPTDGPDCSEIDPLTVTFTIDMTYSTSDPASTFDDIISLPFSTTQLQDRYIDLLKSNDVNGGFANLQCISELRIPSSPTTASPTGTSVPSASPMTMVDDLLNDLDLKRSNLLPEIDCHNMVDPQLLDRSQEIEISFLYGVQSKTVDHFYLEELEGLILDFLRVSIVMCLDDGERAAPQVWKIDDQQDAAGVIRVRYPEIEDVSTISQCDPTLVDAKGCIMLSTKLLVTSVGVPIIKVHSDVLMLLNDAFQEGAFVDIIPELLVTSYLGPDPEEFVVETVALPPSNSEGGTKKSSRTIAVSFSIAIVVLAGLVACFSFPLARQELFKSAFACCKRRSRQTHDVEESALIEDRSIDDHSSQDERRYL